METKKYICYTCKKYYKSPQSLSNHKNKYHIDISPEYPPNMTPMSSKYPPNMTPINSHMSISTNINKILKKTDNTICEYCNKQMSSYKNLNRHLKTCKIKQKKLDDYDKIMKENEQIKKDNQEIKKHHEEMKKAFDELKTMMMEMMNTKCKMHPKKFNKLINTNTNSNNTNSNINSHNNLTNNLTNNISINIIGLGNEDLNNVFSKEEKLKILRRGYASLEEIIKHTHLNDKYIQFQNIIITNKRSNDAYMYNDELGKFILCNKKEILEELIVYRMDDLIEFYTEYKNKLDPKIIRILEDMFNVKIDDDKYIDKKTDEFNVLFYNLSNKDLLKNHKKIEDNMVEVE